jgi:hypothetical protein
VTVLVDDSGREMSDQDAAVHLSHRQYEMTPVTEPVLLVVVTVAVESPFVITAFVTDRLQSGTPLDVD